MATIASKHGGTDHDKASNFMADTLAKVALLEPLVTSIRISPHLVRYPLSAAIGLSV